MSYFDLKKVYTMIPTWDEFLKYISTGRAKWIFLTALEEGWKNQIKFDLMKRFSAPSQEVDQLLSSYFSLVRSHPGMFSTEELMMQLGEVVVQVNMVRGFLRHAYYIQLDDADEIVAKVDEMLTELGSGTPTGDDCAISYGLVTNNTVSSEAIVLPDFLADEIGGHLALLIDDLQHLLHARSGSLEITSKVAEQILRINELYGILTGKSLVGDLCIQGEDDKVVMES